MFQYIYSCIKILFLEQLTSIKNGGNYFLELSTPFLNLSWNIAELNLEVVRFIS